MRKKNKTCLGFMVCFTSLIGHCTLIRNLCIMNHWRAGSLLVVGIHMSTHGQKNGIVEFLCLWERSFKSIKSICQFNWRQTLLLAHRQKFTFYCTFLLLLRSWKLALFLNIWLKWRDLYIAIHSFMHKILNRFGEGYCWLEQHSHWVRTKGTCHFF